MENCYNETIRKRNAAFNVAVVRDFLLGLTVPPEAETRFGVPSAQLQRWIQELAANLGEERFPGLDHRKPAYTDPVKRHGKLSDGELHFLLDGAAGVQLPPGKADPDG